MQRITACVGVLGTLLLAQPSAQGDTRLRGIAADVAAGRMLSEAEAAAALDTRAEETEAELASLSAQEQQASQTLRTRVRALYRITRAGMAPVSGGFDAVRMHVARIKRMTLLVKSEIRTLQTLRMREKSVHDRVAQQAAAQAKANELLHPAAAAAIPPLTPEAIRGNDPRPPAGGGAFYGLRLAEPAEDTGFGSKQGRLASPVAGEVRVVDARRSESEGSGVEFQAPAGTPVRAVASGRVAFCDRYGSYGRLIILDHGNGYYTAYGGLGNLEVRVGDELSEFARMATISGDGGTPALYFEVRKGTKTLAPRAWLGM